MNRPEAKAILHEQLQRFVEGGRPRLEALAETGAADTFEIASQSATYQIEIQCFRDGDKLLVVGSIDDGGIRAFFPLTATVLVPRG